MQTTDKFDIAFELSLSHVAKEILEFVETSEPSPQENAGEHRMTVICVYLGALMSKFIARFLQINPHLPRDLCIDKFADEISKQVKDESRELLANMLKN